MAGADAKRSSANPHTSRGCQKRSRSATAPIDTSAARTSVNSGPTKLETANCTTANVTPAVMTAGSTSSIRFQPASTTIRKPGMMTEKSGSCRPTMAESRRVTWV